MEDYEKFVTCRLDHLRKSIDNTEPSPATSLIRFHGKPILPPLVSQEQREEMKLHREAALKSGVHTKLKEKQVKAFVLNVLDSVQLRHPPTLDNFLQELNLNKSTSSQDTLGESFDKNLPSSPQINRTDCASQSPNASSALFASSVSSQNKDEGLRNHHDAPLDSHSSFLSDATHPSTVDDAQTEIENYLSEVCDFKKQPFGCGSSEHEESLGNNSCDTIFKTPEIINFPPIDGEKLERSGQEFTLCGDFISVKDICSCTLKSSQYSGEIAKNSSQDIRPDQPHSCVDTRITEYSEAEDEQDKINCQSSEKPQRLQTLLQKSQEYRQQQRLLRNQSKKTYEKSAQQPKEREKNHSDKENEEIRHKKAGEWRNNFKEKRNTHHFSTAMMKYSSKKSPYIREPSVCKKEYVGSDQKGSKKSINDASNVHKETLKYNTLNTSVKGRSETKQVSVFSHQQTKTPPTQGSVKTGQSDPSTKYFPKLRKHPQVLAPTFSKCFDKHNIEKQSDALSEKISFDQVVHEGSRLGLDIWPISPVGVNGDETNHLPQSSPHANQIELEVSGSKEVESDVGNTESGCGEESDYGSRDYRDGTRGQPKVQGDFSILEQSVQEHRFYDKTADESLDLLELKLVKNLAQERKNKLSTQSFQNRNKRIQSVAQWKRVPDVFRGRSPEFTAGDDVEAPSGESSFDMACELQDIHGHDFSSSILNGPSEPSPVDTLISDPGFIGRYSEEKHMTPGVDGEADSGMLKVKRRLVMHETEDGDAGAEAFRPVTNREDEKDPIHQLKQIHAEQIRALQDAHRRQQKDLLRALTMRCGLPQSASIPRSRLEDKPPRSLPELHRPLLVAAVKGFLTRRLLRTERVTQLVRTIRDMQNFLVASQLQSSSRGGVYTKQDCLLLARVAQQLQAARFDVYDVFFSLSAEDRMQLIRSDRELEREKQLRRQGVDRRAPGGRKFLSAATRKSLERKREGPGDGGKV